ncbi:tape measure protein [Enterocloster sp.]|uniref:tape measure protein n=1 Tax=Enterocloster sp. TaxID=2719315 RepID=UPI00399F32C8
MYGGGKAILGASKNTDGFNGSLGRTGAAADVANSSLSRLVKTVVSLAAVKKGMDLTDTYTNTNARLAMITGSLEEQRTLQKDIFAAADRSRGDYTEMANATAKLKMLAGDTFGSNLEAVGFTELLTKSLKVSGAGTAEQNSAFLQLTQAMTSGRLQGDEFVAVMENAPMVADAIAQYMGKTKAELKELSSDGAITADIIKGAMFQAADEINGKFSQMTPTFADTWQKIKNAGTQAFAEVFEKVNTALNSAGVQTALNNFIGLIYLAGEATEGFIDFCIAAWPMVSPFIWAAAVALGIYAGAQLALNGLALISAARFGAQAIGAGLYALSLWATTGATWAETTAQLGLNSALYACPIVWIVGLVLVLAAAFYAGVAAVNHFTGATLSGTGIIGGALGALAASATNSFIFIYNVIAEVVNFFANVWNHPVAAVKILFYDLAITVVGYMTEMARSVEAIINRIPGVEVQISAGLDNFKAGIEKAAASAKTASDWNEVVKKKDFVNGADFANKGYEIGSGLADKASNLFSGFNPNLDGAGGSGIDLSQFATAGSPATVKGTGKGGAVKVETDKEDIEWMRKLAERDYVARIAQNTLAPNIKVEFTGPITKEADTDGVVGHMIDRLKEVIATAPEGVPG